MLDQEDKDFLVKEIRKAVREELTVEMTWEKLRDEKSGQPLAKPELLNEKVFLPSFFVQQLGFQEGAFRGMQSDLNKSVNQSLITKTGIDSLAAILIEMEQGIKTFVLASQKIQQRLDSQGVKQLESNPEQ